ncbi:hypothetical protein N431DRAFT_489935 [Stipitochalara longipes BDJ]|nr:hypothetical protein N431DRAFT_489935 [Stipitochalara longipes BDJ]
MSSRKHRKPHGKALDKSTEWSEWTWDATGYCWYRYRLGPSGEYEYDYKDNSEEQYAAEEDSLEPQTARAGTWSPGPASASTITYSSTSTMLTEGSLLLQEAIPSAVKQYPVGRRFVPKGIKILLDSKEHFARPDTGSDRNIISRAYAKKHGILIRKHKTKVENFRLGTGTFARSIGKAHIKTSVPGIDFEDIVRFHVMEECANPLIMGSEFVREIQLYTRNKHLLVEYGFFRHRLPILNRAGTRRQYIPFTADGHSLMACPDTGSELDFISEECAVRCGFVINASDDVRLRVMLGDRSIVETIGDVNIDSMELKSHGSFAHTFHVLRGLDCDAIFGEELLEELDAFNTCEIILGGEESSELQFNALGNMGYVQKKASKLIHRQPEKQETRLEEHDRLIDEEIYRQYKANQEIPLFQTELWATEYARRAAFEQSHERCDFCLKRPLDKRPSAW